MSKNRFLGGLWPVAQRELREGARRPLNYWLRVGAGAAGLLMVVYVLLSHARLKNENIMGLFLFPRLHFMLMGLICLVAPCMTADCIAREKRDGTLGLLFLTPLTAGGIVAGKGLAQGLRALTLWVALAPVLTIPFLMGGIGWAEASAALALEFSALVLCLAAGLLASTLVRGRGAALVLALVLGGGLVAAFCWLAFGLFLAQIPTITLHDVLDSREALTFLLSGLPLDCGQVNAVPDIPINFDIGVEEAVCNLSICFSPAVVASTSQLWNQILWESPIPAVALFVLVLRFAAWRMAGSWRDKIPSARQESLVRTYCTPVFRRWFARRTRRTLDRNPIAWLQQYSWKERVGKWVLCLVFVVAVTVLVCGNRQDYSDFGAATALLFLLTIAAGMTFAGINSFAEEKQSGALELILVTPIPINQIIFGRVLGVWKQFLPAALMLAFFDAARLWILLGLHGQLLDTQIFVFLRDYFPARLLVVCGFITLPVFALYFTLRSKNPIVAAAKTWVVMVLPCLFFLPFVVGYQFHLERQILLVLREVPVIWAFLAAVLTNLALAAAVLFDLRRRLSRRLYSF
jgi:ABC-type Na+ efflux pump permease subunit